MVVALTAGTNAARGTRRPWVRLGSRATQSRLPLFPPQQTLLSPAVTSEKCHERTHAAHKLHFYSISSSARPLSASGTVIPSAFAVLRLIISSTLVDLWTGRSPG